MTRAAAPLARGLSLVELMVGITIGLFILAAASMVATSQLNDNRRLLLEAQVQQDVRLATELVARDLRRAGYWGNAHRAVWPAAAWPAASNPYGAMAPANAAGTGDIQFARSQDEENAQIINSENDTVDDDEAAGYRYNAAAKTIEIEMSRGNWQTLTDPTVLLITRFSVRMSSTATPLPCGVDCPATGPGGCLLQQVQRNATIEVEGQSATDANVRRSASSDVRLRNNLVQCV